MFFSQTEQIDPQACPRRRQVRVNLQGAAVKIDSRRKLALQQDEITQVGENLPVGGVLGEDTGNRFLFHRRRVALEIRGDRAQGPRLERKRVHPQSFFQFLCGGLVLFPLHVHPGQQQPCFGEIRIHLQGALQHLLRLAFPAARRALRHSRQRAGMIGVARQSLFVQPPGFSWIMFLEEQIAPGDF